MFSKRFVQAIALAGSVLATSAHAAPVRVDFGFVPFTVGGVITHNGANVGAATSIDFSSVVGFVVNTVSPSDRSGVELLDFISPIFGLASNPVANFVLGTQDISGLGWTKTWDTTGSGSCGGGSVALVNCTLGTYVASFTTLKVTTSGADNLSWVLSGTVLLPDSTTIQSDLLSASFTDVGADTLNVSFTETSVPAPAVLGLMGLGLMGLGFVRRAKA